MAVRSRPPVNLERQLAMRESIKFAQSGGTPKGAPACYGAPDSKLVGRKNKRHCDNCDTLLQEMCKQYAHFLKRLTRGKEISYDEQKKAIALEYEIRAEGKLTNVKLERMKRRKKKK